MTRAVGDGVLVLTIFLVEPRKQRRVIKGDKPDIEMMGK